MRRIGWIVQGLVAGAIAKALHWGGEPGSVLGTLAVGVAGGLIASTVGLASISSFFSLATWPIAIGGAFLLPLLLAFDAIARHGAARGSGEARA